MISINNLLERPRLSDKDFNKVSEYITQNFGIKLPHEKLILVESRLIKRLAILGLTSFNEYTKYLFSSEGCGELNCIIDFISTNKTDFFREVHHFKFIENYFSTHKVSKPFKFWSSACSTGEEPYTLSMVIEELKEIGHINSSCSIHATDISNSVLTTAIKGEYSMKSKETIPPQYLKKYFTSDEKGENIKITAKVKSALSFSRFNLIDKQQYLKLESKFDFIFCRNVLIYFDAENQRKVIDNLVSKLLPGGFLFLGHSETIFDRALPLHQIQPTIYQRI